MTSELIVGPTTPSRQLLRVLRSQPDLLPSTGLALPESVLWRCYCELRRRGEPGAEGHFLGSVKLLHRRRSIGGSDLPTDDTDPEEHKLVDDVMLGDLWRAYKRAICSLRIGPASQLLRDLEAQMTRN